MGEVLKTKAHRSIAVAREQGDLEHFRGNAVADEWAKRGARHCGPTDKDVRDHMHEYKARVGVIQAIAAVLSCFEPVSWGSLEGVPREKAPKTSKLDGRTKQPHHYVWCGERQVYICRACLHYKTTSRHVQDKRTCKGLPGPIRELARDPRGHKLFVCLSEATGVPVVFCRRCGCYTETNFVKLREDCLAEQSKQRRRLRAILGGRHPTKNEFLGRPWRLQLGTLSGLCGHTWAGLSEGSSGQGLGVQAGARGGLGSGAALPEGHYRRPGGKEKGGFDDSDGSFCSEPGEQEEWLEAFPEPPQEQQGPRSQEQPTDESIPEGWPS